MSSGSSTGTTGATEAVLGVGVGSALAATFCNTEGIGRSFFGSMSTGGAAAAMVLSWFRPSELMSVTETDSPSFGSTATPKRM